MASREQIGDIINGIENEYADLARDREDASVRRRALQTSIVSVLHLIGSPPPGRPADLRTLAQSFRKLGTRVEEIAADVEGLARKRLPELWESSAGLSAREVVSVTSKLMDRTQPAMRLAARALTEHAERVEKLNARHREHYAGLTDVFHDAARATSRAELDRLTTRALDLYADCRQVYQRSLAAADDLVEELKAVQKRAVAQRFEDMGAANAVMLATATRGGKFKTILTEAEARKAAELRQKLSPEERARLGALLSEAPTPEHQAYLLKAFAAGHSLDAVGRFAEQIKDKSPTWLSSQPNLIRPAGNQNSGNPNDPNATNQNADDQNANSQNANDQGQQAPQAGQNPPGSPGSSNSQPGSSDPSAGDPNSTGDNQTGDPGDNGTGQNGNSTGAGGNPSEQPRQPTGEISARANPYWAGMAGETPEGMAEGLNAHAAELGTTYESREVDRGSVRDALKDSVSAVDKGHGVPVRIGDAQSQQWLLLIGRDGDELIFDNPDGKVVRVKEDDFLNGCLGEDKKAVVSSVVLPKGTATTAAPA
ncbi:hypothetical protein ACGFIG_24510 [Micromonospora sp. NPDC049048]|uniref:hypothetical protein n=1 Tax=Micromonospora sp. NPDC049048 TaxID=3364263 RepID=UPI003710F1EC